jgi:Raf kinase inhibitor-like YbhB/YbcL family protein
MHLTSPAFSDAQRIPRRFTCDGEDLSVPLRWSDAPADTRSFVLLCEDPDAPSGVWHHWAVYDIPPDQTELAEGIDRPGVKSDLKQAVNDFGTVTTTFQSMPVRLFQDTATSVVRACPLD